MTLVVVIGGGVLLDQQLDMTPVFTLAGVALGLVAAGYQLYELTLIGRKDRPAGPLGRRLERGAAARLQNHRLSSILESNGTERERRERRENMDEE